ncbi:hypothetical protein PR048_008677 [Dryococelus australis]|uniref:Uncharacterized protein n=1 Tax=Dryococelus australis TaxID=614101 RepID=A0ABQ9HXS6_9NEOP|nr:hypothetical protein PR048_008677 [Dryococelus australis]
MRCERRHGVKESRMKQAQEDMEVQKNHNKHCKRAHVIYFLRHESQYSRKKSTGEFLSAGLKMNGLLRAFKEKHPHSQVTTLMLLSKIFPNLNSLTLLWTRAISVANARLQLHAEQQKMERLKQGQTWNNITWKLRRLKIVCEQTRTLQKCQGVR